MEALWANLSSIGLILAILIVVLVSLIVYIVNVNFSMANSVIIFARDWRDNHLDLQSEKSFTAYQYNIIRRYEKETNIPLEAITEMIKDEQ